MADKRGIIYKYEPLWGMWRVDELIGQDGSGEIYKVYREEWGKRYVSAVKLISAEISPSDIKEAHTIGIEAASMPEYFKNHVNNILNEIEVLYKLRGSSNIVTYEDHAIFEKKDGTGWDILIRTEYLESLPDYMIKNKLSRNDILKLGIDICNALEACERERIIHRAIKDTNIFVSKNGDFKLGNFSIARELSEEGLVLPARSNPLFTAPEVLQMNNCDSNIDTYSLGMVMYKLLNRGRLPFLPLSPHPITAKDTENSILNIMAGKKPVPPVDAGEKLGDIILKACSYNQKDRFKSPAQFKHKLERILREENKAVRSKKNSAAKQKREKEIAITSIVEVNKRQKPAVKQPIKKLVLAGGAAIIILGLFIVFFESTESRVVSEEAVSEVTEISPPLAPTYSPGTVTPPSPPPAPAQPETGDRGEEYYRRGMTYLKSNQYAKAIKAFEEAKKHGYSSTKANKQINLAERSMKIENLYNSAMAYYEQKYYEKAAETFEELIKIDASYNSALQYPNCFFEMARSHNRLGVKYSNEGKLEAALKEFEAALIDMENLKTCGSSYNTGLFSKWMPVYEANRDEILSRKKKTDEYLKSADEHNRAGVKYYNDNKYSEAKQEFEAAVRSMQEIRKLVPAYSAGSYEGKLKIYSDNLKRTEGR